MRTFRPANILIPKTDSMEKWAVIACDQYTSQPEYWQNVRTYVGDAASTLNLILPEAELDNSDSKIQEINQNMKTYMDSGVFQEYNNVYVYIERTMADKTIRKGIIGIVDLEQYDYSNDATTDIRATERTAPERIAPRVNIRKDASLELPHILLLCDDERHMLIESVESIKDCCPVLYDFDLMENGGHITGWLVADEHVVMFNEKLDEYRTYMQNKFHSSQKVPMLYAMGDGNHSLATAKACYEELKKNNPNKDLSNHPARYALLELENIHDDSQHLEPIHRIVTGIDVDAFLTEMKNSICAENGHKIIYCVSGKEHSAYLNKELGELPIIILQKFLDTYLEKHSGSIDYIHGDDVVKTLSCKDHSIGFILPGIDKADLFKGIIMDGVLPRKTFSMGHAQEKRYYLEARKITE